MKNFIFLLVFFIAAPAFAYQAGPANRTNFAGVQKEEQSQTGYRSFSNYNKRNWSRGVQTQPVQTEVAGTSAVDFEKNTPQKLVGKVQSAAQPAAKPAQPQPPQTQASTQPSAANMPANMDPAAMMQQVQGMMNALGASGAQPAQNPASGQNAPAMPAGMPDISALMGGNMPAVPAASPAKK